MNLLLILTLGRGKLLDYLKDYIIQHKAILIYATHSTDTDVANFSDKK